MLVSYTARTGYLQVKQEPADRGVMYVGRAEASNSANP